MKKATLLFTILLLGQLSFAQTKKVLFEEFTGAKCGSCPSGTWILDSMTRKHANVIGVALHSYQVFDAMYYTQLDTINYLIDVQGAPFGDIDRMQVSFSSSVYMLFN